MTFDDRANLRDAVQNTDDLSYSEATFFESYYRVGADGAPDDRATIGPMISRAAARFHYNAVENAIIRALARRDPLPYGSKVKAWEMLKDRADLNLLDVGSGSGHWIDFFMSTFHVKSAVGVEIAANCAAHLQGKYKNQPSVRIVQGDIAEGGPDIPEQTFNYITAIGVMFHIVDDGRWRRALSRLSSLIKPEGLILIGGDFGAETRNIQFHGTDDFDDWSAYAGGQTAHVNKRVRSLADWHKATSDVGLSVVDLVRAETDWAIHTPENDVLALTRGRRDCG